MEITIETVMPNPASAHHKGCPLQYEKRSPDNSTTCKLFNPQPVLGPVPSLWCERKMAPADYALTISNSMLRRSADTYPLPRIDDLLPPKSTSLTFKLSSIGSMGQDSSSNLPSICPSVRKLNIWSLHKA